MATQRLSAGLSLDDSQIVRLADDAMYWQSRIKSDEAKTDLWGKEKQELPSDANLVLCHEITHHILDLFQIIWFNRTEKSDELWVFTEEEAPDLVKRLNSVAPETWDAILSKISSTCSCVYSVPKSHSFEESMIELLANWLVGGAGSPKSVEHLIACGYVSKEHYRLLLDRTQIAVGRKQKQYEQIVTRTIEHETEIVIVARELGLNPEPSGLGLTLWKAICPSASHGLHISTHRDQFFCGYCSVTGGIDELRQFVKESKRDKDKRIKKSPPTTQLQDELGPRIVEPERESPTAGMSPQQVSEAVRRLMGSGTKYAAGGEVNSVGIGPLHKEEPAARGSKKRRPDEDVIRVVYGIYEFEDGQVIAIKESEAIRRATNIEVLHTARTWAEVKAHLTPEDFSLLCEQFEGDDILFDADGNELEEPPGETVFDRQFIESEYGFDTWYIDPLADMAQWIPDEIQRSYGHLDSGGMGVDTQLSLDPKFEDQIRSELAAHGYWAVRDDDLVSATFEWEEGKLDEIIKGRTAAK